MGYSIVINYFLHIPKTGGTSLTDILDQQYPAGAVLPFQTWSSLIMAWPVDVSKIQLVRGHFGYGIRHLLRPHELRYMTMLRNPVERVISFHHHLTIDHENGRWVYPFPHTPLEAMLEERPELLSNSQVKHLAMDVNVLATEAYQTLLSPLNYNGFEIDLNAFTRRNDVGENELSLAMNRLKEFYFVGLLEYYQSSVNRLCEVMGWPSVLVPHLNILPGRPLASQFSSKVIAKIEDLNALDFKLYDYAKKFCI